MYVFTTYEEAFHLSKQAEGKDRTRQQLALDDLEYFDETFCNNPRLLWYWATDNGGKLARDFAPDLQSYYAKNVASDCPTTTDASWPFGK